MIGAREDPSDAATRARATDPRRSIALEAPAGSGKTSILVLRFLRLLATVEEPEQVLAITFTRKAAGEMRARLLRALNEETSPGPPGGGAPLRELARAVRERSRSLGWGLETNPGRLRIHTIDALNRSLAARLPLAARGAGEREILDQPAVLYRAAARRALCDAQGDAALRTDTDLLFGRLDNDFGRFERLLKEMLAARAHWLPKLLRSVSGADADLCDRVEASLRAIARERTSEARALIPVGLIEQGARLAHEVARRRELVAHARPGAWLAFTHGWQIDALTLEHWRALAQLALTHAGTWRRVFTPREGFALEERGLKEEAARWLSRLSGVPGARELLAELARLPDPQLSRDDARALTALSRLLRLAAGELELLFRESGRADHTAVAAAARQALLAEGLPTDLALRLGADTRHILVDEFQDTSIEQIELLEALTAAWEPGDGRTLFIVGDPMQSIYQFREAEVGLFLRTATRGLGTLHLEPLALTRNFRSAPELVAWANRTFPRCFPERDDARTSAVRYRPCIAGRTDSSAGRVRWHAMAAADFEAEGRAIAALVADLRGAEPGATIAILLTARSHAPPIVTALDAAGIALAGVDLVSLADLPLVRDLQALTRALHHLGDRTAWLALLRAPWCGLTLSEITLLTEPATQPTVWEALSDEATVGRLGEDARARLARTRAALAPVLAQRDRLEAASWVESAWLRLGGPAACADDADLEHARAFFTHLARWSAEPDFCSPLSLEERLAELHATHEGTADAVQVMTIHRAKGLEFDHVIVPGLGRKVRASAEPLLRWLELPRERAGSDLLLAPIPPRGRRGADPLREYLKSLQARRGAHERVRLIYVAATRARSQLHLFADLPASAGEAAPRAGTLLAALWPAVAAEVRHELAEAQAPAREAPSRGGPARLVRLAADWELPVIAAAPPLEGLAGALPEPASLEELERRERAQRELRSSQAAERAVCDQLRRCARRGRWPGADAPARERALRERLMRLGLYGPELELEAQRALCLWDRCAADPQLQWIFSAQHSSGEGPLELSGLEHGRLIALTVDRTFLDATGVRWLVNFRPQGADAAREWRDHALELEKALALARKLEPRQVRGGVYFPVQQGLRETCGE
ncbi:MAG TPA: UvrD-helicase domain-containing protein [Steroidobacteraceae bacterium]|nr:UvrD-helicase domain-containing protein [Steroidobacteraceae bacterium]